MAEIIEARVKQKTGTLAEWEMNAITLLKGEPAFVVGASNEPIEFRIGDGTKIFSDLPSWSAGYSKNQIDSFFGGTSAISGYNKTIWDKVDTGVDLNNNVTGVAKGDTLETLTTRGSTTTKDITANRFLSDTFGGLGTTGKVTLTTNTANTSKILTLATAGIDRFFVLGNGYIGHGTSTPNWNYHSHSGTANNYHQMTNSFTGATGNDGLLFGVDGVGAVQIINRENTIMSFWTNNLNRMSIVGAGRVLVNTTTDDGSSQLQVNGKVKATNIEALNELRIPITSGGTPTGSTAVLSVVL